jgi:putative phage-type endonuclease
MRDTMHDHDNPFATRLRATSADRRTFIGASDAATVLGLSPWSTEMALWLRMTSTELQTPDNAATKRGRYLERGLLDWAADELQATSVVEGIPIDEPGIEGPEPWMAFHPDGALLLDDVWRLAEVKTSRNAYEWGEGDDIPMHIFVQVQYQLACLGDVDEVVVVAYLPIADRLSLHTIARDDAFGRLLVDKLGAGIGGTSSTCSRPNSTRRRRRPNTCDDCTRSNAGRCESRRPTKRSSCRRSRTREQKFAQQRLASSCSAIAFAP